MTDTVKIRVVADTKQAQTEIRKVRGETDKAKKSTEQYSQAIGKINPILGSAVAGFTKVKQAFGEFRQSMEAFKTERTREIANNLYKVQGNISGIGKASKNMSAAVSSAFSSMSSTVTSVLSAFNPVLLAIAAVAAAVVILKKGWEVMKNSFKAFDPQGYAKLFGAFERALRRIRTQLGYLSVGPVKAIMTVVVGMLAVVEDILDAIIEFDKWIKSIQSDLGPVLDILWEILQVASPFFRLMDYFFDRGSEVLQNAAETITEAVSVGLAGFDKLNSFKMGEGDADKINEINGNLEESTKTVADNAEAAKGLWEQIGNLSEQVFDWWGSVYNQTGSWLSSIGDGIGEVWSNFTNSAGAAWGAVTSFAGAFANIASNILGGIWDSFKNTAMGIFDWMASQLGSIINSAISGLKGAINNAQSTISDVYAIATGNGDKQKSDGSTAITSTVGKTLDTVKETGTKSTGLVGLINKGISAIKESSIVKSISSAFKNVASSISSSSTSNDKTVVKTSGGAVNTLLDMAKSFIGSFATGGVFMPNSPQLAIFGDNKVEPEVAAPYSMIVKAVQEAIGASGGASGGERVITIEIPIEIDGRQVARASYDYIENERIRRNRSGAI